MATDEHGLTDADRKRLKELQERRQQRANAIAESRPRGSLTLDDEFVKTIREELTMMAHRDGINCTTAKDIAERVDETPQRVGVAMQVLHDNGDVEPWGGTSSAATWNLLL